MGEGPTNSSPRVVARSVTNTAQGSLMGLVQGVCLLTKLSLA